jgi:hypothetical protein
MDYESFLYRIYNDVGEVIYIGQTRRNVEIRLMEHWDSPWRREGKYVEIWRFRTKYGAANAEYGAIGRSRPKYNLNGGRYARPHRDDDTGEYVGGRYL